MKKFFICVCLFGIMSLFCVSAFASSESMSWYCAHREGHLQPSINPSFEFINKYDAFYIDKKHDETSKEKVIYLTFDAGYNNGNIDRILDVLKEENVTAAFFILGHLVESETELVKRMFEDGHAVCNHTFSHAQMTQKSEMEFREELCRLEDKCFELTGQNLSKYYRPPEGKFDEASLCYAQKMGYKTVFWSFAYDDWDNAKQHSCEKAKKKILDNIHNGEIMLLHPTSSTNAEILGDVIREIKKQGYRFGSLNEIEP